MKEKEQLDSLGRPFPHPTDSPDEEFNPWVETAAVGDSMAVHNLLCQCFNQLREVKDQFVVDCNVNGMTDEKKAVLEKTYAMLSRIEARIFMCKDRTSKLLKEMKPPV